MATNKKRRFKKIHVLLPLGVIVVVAVAAVFIAQTFGAGATTDAQYMTEAVRRGNIEKTISSSGTLAAGTTREVNASVSGTVSTVHVKVGDTVSKGELLFSVADDDLGSAASSASSQLSVAQQQLTAARASLTSAQATQVQTEKEILAELVKSGSTGANVSSGSGSGSTGTGVGAGSTASTNTSSTAGSAKSTPTAAQKKAAKAQAIQSAANKVRAVASAQAEVQSATQSVTNAQKAHNDALSELGKAKVTAPIDGVVTAVSVAKGDVVTGSSSSASAANTGASAATSAATAAGAGTGSTGSTAATSAIEIVNFNKNMTLSVDVSESEINSLKVGMKTALTFDAFEGLEQEGKISEISPLGTTSGGLVTYPVTIELSKPDPQLKPGMTADAVVILESVTDVLMVPNTAIAGRAGKGYTVQVAVGGDTTNLETRTVTLGMANDSYTEVSSGLFEGELVISGSVDASSASSSSGALIGGAPEMRSFGGDPNGGGPGAAAGSGSTSAGTRGASSTQARS